MKATFKIFLIAVFSLFIVSNNALAAENNYDIIRVTGQASKQIKPDIAYITIGIETQNEKVEIARNESAIKIKRIVGALKEFNISEEKIQTANFTLSPVYERNNNFDARKIVGYSLVNTLTIEIKNIDSVGMIVDKAFAAGANRFDGIRFTTTNYEKLEEELLKNAVKNGFNKAQIVAAASDKKIGKLVSAEIYSANNYLPQNIRMDASTGSSLKESSPVFAGNLAISVNIALVYEIL